MPEERTLGGEPGTGQDVTIVLIPREGSGDEKLALIHLHSHVLITHSKYFNTCLSERWKESSASSSSVEFVLEVQTAVKYYFDCFSSMYLPSLDTFPGTLKGVKHGVKLLKVASQIVYEELMKRISFYLSSPFWLKEDEIRIWDYATSPDFPRIYLNDLVVRLGLDESEEDRQKQLGDLARLCVPAAFEASLDHSVIFPGFLQGIGSGPPSVLSTTVIALVSQEAKNMFVNIEKGWNGFVPGTAQDVKTIRQMKAMSRVLGALLTGRVAEEVVRAIVHLDAIPKFVSRITEAGSQASKQKLAEIVLVMYQDVAAGRLLLIPQERTALLANWHAVMKTSLKAGSFEQATSKLFLSLPLKQQVELMNLRKEKVSDYIGTASLMSVLSSHGGLGQPGN